MFVEIQVNQDGGKSKMAANGIIVIGSHFIIPPSWFTWNLLKHIQKNTLLLFIKDYGQILGLNVLQIFFKDYFPYYYKIL